MDEDEEGQGREGIKQERTNEGEIRLDSEQKIRFSQHKHK